MRALEILEYFEKNGIKCFLSIEPCFGACDLRDEEAKKLGCDLLIHIGHEDFGLKTVLPVIYETYEIDFNPIKLLKKNFDKLNFKKITLVSSIQFLPSLRKAKKFLESRGKIVYIAGKILGCDQSPALKFEKKTDCYLFIGSGIFHPLAIAVKTEKPVFVLDIELSRFIDMEEYKKRYEKIKFAQIEKAKEFKNFGIFLSTKKGQFNLRVAEEVKAKIESKGKNAYIIVGDQITPEKIAGLKIDCIINTACPRISEDFKNFGKIILNPDDVDKI
jgi:2-(3-amino-3-carboxypropyl)histidine synthase